LLTDSRNLTNNKHPFAFVSMACLNDTQSHTENITLPNTGDEV